MNTFTIAFNSYSHQVRRHLRNGDPYQVDDLLRLYRRHMKADSRNKTEATKLMTALHDAVDATMEDTDYENYRRHATQLRVYEATLVQAQNDLINLRHSVGAKKKISFYISESDSEDDEYESDFVVDDEEEDPNADYDPFVCV